MTRCPIELRLRSHHGENTDFDGRVECTTEKGERRDWTFTTPEDAGSKILDGDIFLKFVLNCLHFKCHGFL